MHGDSEPLHSKASNYDYMLENEHNVQMAITEPPPATLQHPLLLGPDTTVTMCPFCRSSIKTAVQYKVTTRTHMAAALCCCIYCCCCLPYCCNSAKNTDHYCPNCNKFLGTYEK